LTFSLESEFFRISKIFFQDSERGVCNYFVNHYIKFVYEQDLKNIDKIDLSQQAKFNQLKGRFLENVVQVTMRKFNHERIQGEWMGKSGMIELPLFDVVDSRQIKASKTKSYQIDVFARRHDITWLCECK
jgi:hypothetical protein